MKMLLRSTLVACLIQISFMTSAVFGADANPKAGNVTAPLMIQQGVGTAGAKTRNIKCPAEVQVELHRDTDYRPWSGAAYVIRIEKAQITYQEIYGKDSLQCSAIGRPWLYQLADKGACTVGRDNLSFDCRLPETKIK